MTKQKTPDAPRGTVGTLTHTTSKRRRGKRTERGFRDYGVVKGNLYGTIAVLQEDSVAYKGAHVAVRIFEDRGRRSSPAITKRTADARANRDPNYAHAGFLVMPVKVAKKFRDALTKFIDEAEGDDLCEPATYPRGVNRERFFGARADRIAKRTQAARTQAARKAAKKKTTKAR